MMRKIFFVVIFIALSINVFSQTYSVVTVPNPKDADANTFVANPDGIISQETESKLNNMLRELEANNKLEVAVVVLNSIGDEDIFDFGVKLFEQWGIGKKNNDNGLLVLFVLDQRKIRFEVGYGLEGILPDAICKRIQTNDMIPHFKSGDYDEGILQGVAKAVEYIEGEPFEQKDDKVGRGIGGFTIMSILLPAILLVVAIGFLTVKYRQTTGNTSFRFNRERHAAMNLTITNINIIMSFVVGAILILGFFFGFDILGGWLSVVLAMLMFVPFNFISINMLKRIRRHAPLCSGCGNKMRLLSEKDDDKYLTLSQAYEEKIQSVDYDVFLCDGCGRTVINEYKGKADYSECPHCKTRDFAQSSSYIVNRPSYVRTGLKILVFHCAFCGFQNEKSVIMPKLTHSSGSGFGGSSSGGGGGSFGGGRSGGGGATSGW